ncbi:hypothetical protein [Schaalia vaccimaxillae]|uniref:hypothetical protein n=1 Tax=Schaalia vaccimaxillae TaxID=183916 RepID=UPI0003B399B6|nr:hypothetical protein [Schaalia vaccimaxillae]
MTAMFSRLRILGRRWGVALRVTRRGILHDKGRSLSAVVVIALPIVLAISSINLWGALGSPRYAASQRLGDNSSVQAVVSRLSLGPIQQDATAESVISVDTAPVVDVSLEDFTHLIPVGNTTVAVDFLYQVTTQVRGRNVQVVIPSAEQTASLDAPGIDIDASGRLEAGQAVLSRDVAEQISAAPGDIIDLSVEVEVGRFSERITGNAEVAQIIEGETRRLIVGDSTLDVDRLNIAGKTYTSWYVVGVTPVNWQDIEDLNKLGFVAISRSVLADPPTLDELPSAVATHRSAAPIFNPWQFLLIVAGVLLILVEMVLLVSPIFTVTQRSTMRTVAMIAANGGDRQDQRRLMIAHGVLIGNAAAVVSTALSIAVAFGIGAYLGLGITIIPLWTLFLAFALPVALSVVASLTPAKSSAQMDASAVILGRTWMPSRLVRRQIAYPIMLLAALPILIASAWSGHVILLILGVTLLEAGLIGSLPYIIKQWSSPLPTASMSSRLALRDAVRNGHRTFPAMGSILTTVFVASALLITLSSTNAAAWKVHAHVGQHGQVFVTGIDPADSIQHARQIQDRATQALQRERSVSDSVVMQGLTWKSGVNGPEVIVEAVSGLDGSTVSLSDEAPAMAELDLAYIVDDGSYLQASGLLGDDELVDVVTTLERGGVLVPEEHLVSGRGTATIRSVEIEDTLIASVVQGGQVSDPQVLVSQDFEAAVFDSVNVIVLSPQAASELKVPVRPLGALVTLGKPVNTFEAAGMESRISQQVVGASINVIAPSPTAVLLPYLAALVALVAAAGTVAMVIVLSSSDMRPDLDILDVLGAQPQMRRKVTTYQGLHLALTCIPVAVLSGLIAGVLAVVSLDRSGIFTSQVGSMVPVIPWVALVGMLIGMPLVAAVVAFVLTPRRQERLRRINS